MKLSPKKGFTLIEIVIVLAIAALIMVIVFIAVQGAQRSQRDTATKDTAARLLAAANVYASNSGGTFPNNATEIAKLTAATPAGYGVVLPSGATIAYSTTLPTTTGVYNLNAAKCDNSVPGFAVRYYQEQGGSQCLGN